MDIRSSVKTGQTTVAPVATATLRKRQRTIIKRLQALTPHVIRGSVITRYTRCGKPRCRCVTGRGHGPKYYLSVSKRGKRPHLIYIPQAKVAQIQEQLGQLRTFRTLLEELCDIACEFLTRRVGE